VHFSSNRCDGGREEGVGGDARWLSRVRRIVESTFATVRLRTAKTRGCVSRAGILAMVFKLTKSAEQKWRKLKGHARLAQVVQGVRFKDGLQEEETQRIAA
jgi:putative transposase